MRGKNSSVGRVEGRSATALLKDTEAVIKWFTKEMKLEE